MKIIHADGFGEYVTKMDWENGKPFPDTGPIEKAMKWTDEDAQSFMDSLSRWDRGLFSVEEA